MKTTDYPCTLQLLDGGRAVILPDVIVVYNFVRDDDGILGQLFSANPGKPSVFLSTVWQEEVFGQAANTNRSFVFHRSFVDQAEADPQMPAQWLSAGHLMPALPGNISVTATATGFEVATLNGQYHLTFP